MEKIKIILILWKNSLKALKMRDRTLHKKDHKLCRIKNL